MPTAVNAQTIVEAIRVAAVAIDDLTRRYLRELVFRNGAINTLNDTQRAFLVTNRVLH